MFGYFVSIKTQHKKEGHEQKTRVPKNWQNCLNVCCYLFGPIWWLLWLAEMLNLKNVFSRVFWLVQRSWRGPKRGTFHNMQLFVCSFFVVLGGFGRFRLRCSGLKGHLTSPNPSFCFVFDNVFLICFVLVWDLEVLGWGGAQRAPPHLTLPSLGFVFAFFGQPFFKRFLFSFSLFLLVPRVLLLFLLLPCLSFIFSLSLFLFLSLFSCFFLFFTAFSLRIPCSNPPFLKRVLLSLFGCVLALFLLCSLFLLFLVKSCNKTVFF